jgi:hypothetical protein
MKLRTAALGCLAVFAMLLGSQLVTAQDANKDGATYTVIIHRLEVKQTNQDGNSWDINDGKPDLKVTVRNISEADSKEFETTQKEDTFTAEWNVPTTVKFRSGQGLLFVVHDVDVAASDEMGRVRKFYTEVGAEATAAPKDARPEEKATLKEGRVKFENFGQVILLEIEIKKL